MLMKTLKFGQSLVGLLIDGVNETPYTGATLRMNEPRGVVVEVPYIQRGDTDQFDHVDKWFDTQTPPTNMILETPVGSVGLFGVQWHGHSGSRGVSLGKLAPSETLLGHRDAELADPLTVTEVISEVDGLREWTRFTAVETDHETDDKGLATGVLIHVRSDKGVSWQQGEATVTFQTDWSTDYPDDDADSGLNIADRTVLVTKFPTSRSFTDHLVEQRKVVQLLVLVAGNPIKFRRHRVTDETLVTLSVGNTVMGYPRVDLISSQTVREYAQPIPSKEDFHELMTRFPDVGADGMQRWAEEHEKWKRFILPAVGVLGRKGAFTEDLITSTSMSIEAAGAIIGKREEEKETYSDKGYATTATNVFRCLDLLNVNWGGIAPNNVALARAVAKTYNDIKHFDRGEFPDPQVSHIVSLITRYIVQLITLTIVDPTGDLLKQYREEGALWKVKRMCEVYKLTINEQGQFVPEDEGDS